jgi:hypothetical protein
MQAARRAEDGSGGWAKTRPPERPTATTAADIQDIEVEGSRASDIGSGQLSGAAIRREDPVGCRRGLWVTAG